MSEKNAYRLINPYIEGSFDTVVRAKNSFNAGKKMYNSLSNFFTNHVEDFYMTLQNVETKELSHFKIGEKMGKNGTVDFKLVKIEDSFTPDLDNKLINSVEKLEKQSGGKKHHHRREDSSSSSSSSSSESDYYYNIPIQPISRFVYYWLPYYKLNLVGLTPTDYSRLFLPMFSLPINPTVEIKFDLYKIN